MKMRPGHTRTQPVNHSPTQHPSPTGWTHRWHVVPGYFAHVLLRYDTGLCIQPPAHSVGLPRCISDSHYALAFHQQPLTLVMLGRSTAPVHSLAVGVVGMLLCAWVTSRARPRTSTTPHVVVPATHSEPPLLLTQVTVSRQHLSLPHCSHTR